MVKGVGPGVKRGQAGVIKSGWIGVVQRGDAVRQDQWSGRAGVGGGLRAGPGRWAESGRPGPGSALAGTKKVLYRLAFCSVL